MWFQALGVATDAAVAPVASSTLRLIFLVTIALSSSSFGSSAWTCNFRASNRASISPVREWSLSVPFVRWFLCLHLHWPS